MEHKGARHILLALGLAVAVGLAGCSGGDTSSGQDQGPVNTTDNLEGLVGGEPLDQIQVILDKLLVDGLAANLPEFAGRELVASISNAVLTLLDAPDELLEALLSVQTLAEQGESDPALFQTLLQDTGAEIFTHTRDAVVILLSGLQSLVPQGSAKPFGGAPQSLVALDAMLSDPAGITDVEALVAQMKVAAADLAALDLSALNLSGESAEGAAAALQVMELTMSDTADMISGFSSPATGFPDVSMVTSVENMLFGLVGLIEVLASALAGIPEGELDLAPVLLDLVAELDVLLGDVGILPGLVTVVYEILAAVLTPVTGGLSALLCGLLPICD